MAIGDDLYNCPRCGNPGIGGLCKRCASDDLAETHNNGGPTDYYDLKPSWKGAGDIIEGRKMNFNQGNMFKVAFCFNVGRHSSTTYERELNKLKYFADRELKRIKNEEES